MCTTFGVQTPGCGMLSSVYVCDTTITLIIVTKLCRTCLLLQRMNTWLPNAGMRSSVCQCIPVTNQSKEFQILLNYLLFLKNKQITDFRSFLSANIILLLG